MPQKSITLNLISESYDTVKIEDYYLDNAEKSGVNLRSAIFDGLVAPAVESAIYAGDGLVLSVHRYNGNVISRSLDEVKVGNYISFGVPTYSLVETLKEQVKAAYGEGYQNPYLISEEQREQDRLDRERNEAQKQEA